MNKINLPFNPNRLKSSAKKEKNNVSARKNQNERQRAP